MYPQYNQQHRHYYIHDVPHGASKSNLEEWLKQKGKSIKADSDYERNQKLVRFAVGRGFTFDIIRQCMDTSDINEDEFEQDED